MSSEDKFPRLSKDLLEWLDEYTARPSFPLTPVGVKQFNEEDIRLGCFQAGARNLVDQLMAWHAESEGADDTNSDSDAPEITFDSVFGRGRGMDQTEVSVPMVGFGLRRIISDDGEGPA